MLFTSDDEIRALNKEYRGIDEATDVLTFPAGPILEGGLQILGDIAISVPFALRQAPLHGHSGDEELTILAIHGGLHLLGYDDQDDESRADMLRRMGDIAREVQIPMHLEWSTKVEGSVDG